MTIRLALMCLLLCALGCGLAAAQPAPWRAAEAQEEEEAAGEGSDEGPEAAAEAKTGDIITLKTGKELHGVQIIRENPRIIALQVVEGMAPMILQRKFVKSVQYDDIDPSRKKGPTEGPKLSVIVGKKVSGELRKKLVQPLSEEPLVYEKAGFVKLVKELAAKVDVTVEIGEACKIIPVEERARNFNIKPGTPLFSFLQEDFVAAYPKLEVVYLYDKIVITTKEDAKARAEKRKQEKPREAPPAPDAPAES